MVCAANACGNVFTILSSVITLLPTTFHTLQKKKNCRESPPLKYFQFVLSLARYLHTISLPNSIPSHYKECPPRLL